MAEFLLDVYSKEKFFPLEKSIKEILKSKEVK
jgi:hypothetical protein